MPETHDRSRRTPIDLSRPLGRLAVFDLETRDDALLTGLGTSAKAVRPFVQRIASFSLLTVTEPSIGRWEIGELTSHHGDETDILAAIDAAFGTNPTLVTYNGSRHDLPVIRRRIMRHRRYRLEAALRAPRLPHIDLFTFPHVPAGGHHGSLQDRCAGLGIDAKTYLDGRDGRSRMVLKGEVDSVATFLLLIHELAALRIDGQVWAAGVRALEQAGGGEWARRDHLSALIGGGVRWAGERGKSS